MRTNGSAPQVGEHGQSLRQPLSRGTALPAAPQGTTRAGGVGAADLQTPAVIGAVDRRFEGRPRC